MTVPFFNDEREPSFIQSMILSSRDTLNITGFEKGTQA